MHLKRVSASVVVTRCMYHWPFFPADLPSSQATESSLFTEFEENCIDYGMFFSCTLLASRHGDLPFSVIVRVVAQIRFSVQFSSVQLCIRRQSLLAYPADFPIALRTESSFFTKFEVWKLVDVFHRVITFVFVLS